MIIDAQESRIQAKAESLKLNPEASAKPLYQPSEVADQSLNPQTLEAGNPKP